jgi:hypothetical protein
VTQLKNQRKTNGHAGSQGRPNGHAPASTERGGIPGLRGQAASDDARGASLAMDASIIHAPGTDHDACAEVAPPHPPGTPSSRNSHARETAAKDPDSKEKPEPIPGGEFPLPADPCEFVEEIHRRASLLEVWQRLLNHEDPKIQQRAVEKLTEMRYKGASALADEPQQIVIDIDSAVARRAAEGARS